MKWEIFLLYIFFHLIWQNSSCLYEPVPHVMRTEHIFTFKGIGFLNRTTVNTRLQRKKKKKKRKKGWNFPLCATISSKQFCTHGM